MQPDLVRLLEGASVDRYLRLIRTESAKAARARLLCHPITRTGAISVKLPAMSLKAQGFVMDCRSW